MCSVIIWLLVREMFNKLKDYKGIIFVLIILFLTIVIVVVSELNFAENSKSVEKQSNKNKAAEKNKIINEDVKIDATKEYYCPDGFTLSGTTCNSTIETIAVKTYECDEGVPIATTGECSTYVNEYVEPIWYCTGTIPFMSESQISSYCNEKGYPRNLLGCPSGYSPDYQQNKCWKLAEKRVPAKVNYLCPDDYKVDGDKCKKIMSVDANYRLKCPYGYKLTGIKCTKDD